MCLWLSDALFLELTQIRMNYIEFWLHIVRVGRELRDCLVEAPCFLGLVFRVIFFLRPINLVICFDDITGKELPWHAVHKARELELKYLRDLGVYEKVDEKEAVEKYGVTPVDTKWVDTDKAFEGEPMQIRSRMCAREFKSYDRPVLYAGTPPLEALKAIISIAANHKETFSIMRIDVSRAYFHAKAQRPVLIRLPAEDRMGTDAGKIGLMKKSTYGTRDAASNWERDWQEHVKKWGFQLGLSSKNLFHPKENRVSRLTHGDDFVLAHWANSVYPIKAKIISLGSPKSIKTLNRRLHWQTH